MSHPLAGGYDDIPVVVTAQVGDGHRVADHLFCPHLQVKVKVNPLLLTQTL